MIRKNKIRKIINEKFGLKPEATKDQLQKLGMTPTRFNHIIKNQGAREMDAIEIKRIADWLDVEESELWEDEISQDEMVKKHGIIS
jgi:uncharacterized tellurite resistance protein B-like protein